MKTASMTLLFAGLMAGCCASATGRLADVRIVDRDDGAVLTPHYYRGEYWVAGRPGARYAIEVRNRLGERLLAVTAVDGVNVLSGETAGWDQTGYVFDAGERYAITGWRKSDSAVAAFTFSAPGESYAQRTGRPANLGVIGIALFREQATAARQVVPQALESPLAAPANAAGATDALSARASPALPGLGTGHGEREVSYVSHTDFARRHDLPDEVIRIRYDSPENLVAMGILPRERPVAHDADPFPASRGQGYVPDPPG